MNRIERIISKCHKCERVTTNRRCRSYAIPMAKWKNGKCNFRKEKNATD